MNPRLQWVGQMCEVFSTRFGGVCWFGSFSRETRTSVVSAPRRRVKEEFYRGAQGSEPGVWEEPRASRPPLVADGPCAVTDVRWSPACLAMRDHRVCPPFPPVHGEAFCLCGQGSGRHSQRRHAVDAPNLSLRFLTKLVRDARLPKKPLDIYA